MAERVREGENTSVAGTRAALRLPCVLSGEAPDHDQAAAPGVEYGIAPTKLMRIGSLNEAAEWLAGFSNWCTAWEGF